MKQEKGATWKLGMFVSIGLVILVGAIYYIGKQKNYFGSTFKVSAVFKTVSGLKVGNNIRFSGINVGTIDEIMITSDTTVNVDMIIKKDVQKFIKADASATIGSDGLMGDKVVTIYPGSASAKMIQDNDKIQSAPAIEMEQVMVSIKATADNAAVISSQLAQFATKMNNGNGALSKLISDEGFSNNIQNTMQNLETSSGQFATFTTKMNSGKGALSKLVTDEKFGKKLDSSMANIESSTKSANDVLDAAKSNFLLRGFFKKKKRAEEKRIKDSIKTADKLRKKELKAIEELNKQKPAATPDTTQ